MSQPEVERPVAVVSEEEKNEAGVAAPSSQDKV